MLNFDRIWPELGQSQNASTRLGPMSAESGMSSTEFGQSALLSGKSVANSIGQPSVSASLIHLSFATHPLLHRSDQGDSPRPQLRCHLLPRLSGGASFRKRCGAILHTSSLGRPLVNPAEAIITKPPPQRNQGSKPILPRIGPRLCDASNPRTPPPTPAHLGGHMGCGEIRLDVDRPLIGFDPVRTGTDGVRPSSGRDRQHLAQARPKLDGHRPKPAQNRAIPAKSGGEARRGLHRPRRLGAVETRAASQARTSPLSLTFTAPPLFFLPLRCPRSGAARALLALRR